MKVNHYVFPENIPMNIMLVLAKQYGLEITLDVPKEIVKKYYLEKEYIDSMDEEISDDLLIISFDGNSPNAEYIMKQFPYPIKSIKHSVSFLKLTEVKRLIKQYGGYGFTEFYHRGNGEFYGCTPIELNGSNQRVGYKIKV